MNKVAEFLRPYKAIYKRCLSYFTKNWDLENFPIEYRKQEMSDLTGTHLTMYPWEARIINWFWMNGDGHSKEEAYKNLEERFKKHVSKGREIPRPGTRMTLTFASSDKIEHLDEETVEFFRIVFNMDYHGMFISDESSIYDFCWSDELIEEKAKIINQHYGIEINKIEGLRIADILGRIKEGTGIA
ncbi:hypothetical protein EJP77_18705 [Paenibacillus zeisoli]|uniref:Uncharacterized protein n=1 Tax=Paenibacillus zeisoli TaxID=2496267 RepID=A0A3S1D3I8_9BACL|nr:hypothetical protein [Paenibacillus zeisoli]RUT28047.1 hypothetical protein EJP77_18705 [Paenibacillus zeisoli]